MSNTAALRDPVCGMTVTEMSPHRHTHEGRTTFFCSEHCRAKFAGEPRRFLAPEAAPAPAPEATVYVCPMHPEVRQDHPGACPKCGMALEPRTVTAEEEENPELVDMTRRFWVSLVLTAPPAP